MKYIKVPQDAYDSMVLLLAELKEDNRELEVTRLKHERTIEALKNATAENSDEEFEN